MDIIQSFMNSPVYWISSEANIRETALEMQKKKVSALFIKNKEEIVGIITKTDLVFRVLAKGLGSETTKVAEVMTSPVLSQDHYVSRSQAHDFMQRNKIKHLAVSEHGKIVGMLTLRDLVT